MPKDELSAIDREFIDKLVENGVPENRSLEYKEMLCLTTGDERREFLADVSAFANSSGGELYFGIRELRDANGKTTGIPEEAVGLANTGNRDKLLLQVQDIIKDGLSPTISGVILKMVDGFKNGPILVLHIPESWRAPHQIAFQNNSKFYARRMSGKYQMDIDDIRDAFLSAESIPERMRNLRSERVMMLLKGETPMPTDSRHHIAYLFIPLSALSSKTRSYSIDLQKAWRSMPFATGINGSTRFNLDGLLNCHTGTSSSPVSYGHTQVFRNGIVEIVDSYTIDDFRQDDGGPFVRPIMVENSFIKAIESANALFENLGMSSEMIYVFVSLLGVKGYRLYQQHSHVRYYTSDRENMFFPDFELKDLVSKNLRPLCDTFWQAFGAQSSPNFNKEGNYGERI